MTPSKSAKQIKATEKAVERLAKARQEKERFLVLTENRKYLPQSLT